MNRLQQQYIQALRAFFTAKGKTPEEIDAIIERSMASILKMSRETLKSLLENLE